MNRLLFTLLVSIFVLNCSSSDAEIFGEGVTLTETTSLASVLSDVQGNAGKEYRLEGVVVDVCQKKGCWMDIKDGEEVINVRFKDYGFFMPKDGAGRKAIVQGIFSRETYIDEDCMEENKPADEKECERVYNSFTASGVLLEKSKEG